MEPTEHIFDMESGSFYIPTSKDHDVLIAGLSYHLNNIFSIIHGYSHVPDDILHDKEKIKRNIDIIHKTVDRGVSIIEKLQIYTQKTSVLFEVIDLDQLVRDAAGKSYEHIGDKTKVLFQQETINLTVVGDKKLLREALCQLIFNASDAMPGGGKIKISTNVVSHKTILSYLPTITPGSYVMISVIDRGVGIDELVRENLFEPFVTTKEVDQGVGLGLSVVYGVVARHKGCIHIKSKPGEGTTFTLFIPLSELSHH